MISILAFILVKIAFILLIVIEFYLHRYKNSKIKVTTYKI